LQKLWRLGSVNAGDRVIVTMGDQTGRSGGTNTLRLIKLDNEGGSESETRLDLG
jgi:pyruvate kinase